ncbi:MAG TPA: hypothetical protein VFZ24_03385 [Longimicrobiales bacterium]
MTAILRAGISGALPIFLVSIGLAGCAPRTAVATGGALDVVMSIENDIGAEASVYVLSESGLRRRLGRVDAGTTVRYSRYLHPGDYRLIAERTGGAGIVSDPFRVSTDSMSVTWRLARNEIMIR